MHRFLLDQNVDDRVRRVLEDEGHMASPLRAHLDIRTPDTVIAQFSGFTEAILISHDRDFGSISPRIPVGRQRFRRLSRIALHCSERSGPTRLKLALPFIAFEWAVAQASGDRRMILEIGESYLRTNR